MSEKFAVSNTKQNRGANGNAKRTAGKKNDGEKLVVGVILAFLAIVAAVSLILEFCTPYKPSNAFKKETIPKVEQTGVIPENSDSEEPTLGELNFVEQITEHTAGELRQN